ncbi:S-layer protein [Fischerella thermalis CCMEE 5268]|uniref:S-layer protein n=1 Tax=Fischerella thermalis CCMEE 5268 TaxID=2019662 RepID=A0A2N6K9J6_9CYAN|nr:iron uptake porin [Fischerella thermalis]PLZ94747.1 S-layer protein [Fischerella thermalis CCMEE 5268]
MSNIGLLVVGVLATGQTPPATLPEQLQEKPENRLPEINATQTNSIVPVAEITPAEFILQEQNINNIPDEFTRNKYKKILLTRFKIKSHNSSVIAAQPEVKKQQKFTNQPDFSQHLEKPSPIRREDLRIPPSLGAGISPHEVKSQVNQQVVKITEENISSDSNNQMSKVTSVSQLDDVQPQDWAFGALQSLVERYGCIAGYPDNTFLGNRVINRYEFAAGLAACLKKINELIANNTNNTVTEEDLILLQRLETEFQAQLQELQERVANLEAQTEELQTNQFSPTTKLVGQAIFSLQGTNETDIDLFPRDGKPERTAETNLNFANSAQLTLATSFSGKDLLLTSLASGNLNSSAPYVYTNMGRLGFEADTNSNDLVINELSYRFPVSDQIGFVVGTAGVNPVNTFRGINPLEGAGEGAISLFAQRNPILAIGNSTGGVGFDWQISDRISLQGIYSAEIPSFPNDTNLGGIFGGRYTTGAQLTLAPTDNIDVGIHYLFSHSPDGLLGNGIGDAQLISPFAPSTAFNTHAVGATATWRINPNLQLGAWGGWTHSNPVNLSGSVETTNWAVFAAFPNLGRPGNLGGILFGQPPKITSSTLPEGYNFPNFSNGGTAGGREDTSVHAEIFYRAQLNNNIALTPGVFIIFNPDHNTANYPLIVGALRATFRF